MRQLIQWTLILVVVFVVFIGLAFVGLTYLTPSAKELQAIEKGNKPQENLSSRPTSVTAFSDSTVSTKKSERQGEGTDSLRSVIIQLNGDLFFTRVTIDSLNEQLGLKEDQIGRYLAEIESLESNINTLQESRTSIKDLAKTYDTMKVTDMSPILAKLDDETIIALYKNMGSRTRKNLIQALTGARAAQITKKLAG